MKPRDDHRREWRTASRTELRRHRSLTVARKSVVRSRWAVRLLRAAPAVAAFASLAFFLAGYGPLGHHSTFGWISFVALAVAVTIALGSGAYDPTSVVAWLRFHLRRPRIDWAAFDEARAGWEQRRRP